jgi:nitrogen regulatory protein P-II 1
MPAAWACACSRARHPGGSSRRTTRLFEDAVAARRGATIAQCTVDAMKKVEAIIRPHTIDEVRAALDLIAVPGATVIEVRGSTKRRPNGDHHRGAEYTVDLIPKLMIEVLVDDDGVDDVVDAIMRVARTGSMGDGKLLVATVEDVVRIRTGERGAAAI